MCTTITAQKQRITLAVITRILGFLCHTHQSTIRILAFTCTDTFAHNRRTCIFTQMNHLGTGIGLLIVIGYSNRIEFRRRIISTQDTTRILPRNGRACFHLCPTQLTVHSFTMTALGHEVINTSFAFRIPRIPVLDSGIFHFGTVVYHNLHNSSMQLILITLRSRTSFQIRYITVVIRHNQCTFKLSGICRIDAKISRKFHRTAYSFRNIHKRTIAKYSRV